MKFTYKSILFILITFYFLNAFGQNSKHNKEIIQYFDSIYGADNLLINGRIFMYPNYRAKGNPFFFGKDLKLCDIYINNRKFSNLFTNYNIVEDKLILSCKINNNNINIELNNHLIDSFYISYFVFIKIINQNPVTFSSNIPNTFGSSKKIIFTKKFIKIKNLGYFENIYEGNYQLLRKYIKSFSDKVSQEHSHGAYTGQKTILYIHRDGEFIDVSNKRKFIKTFSKYKKEIKKFLKENKIKYKDANNIELIKLMNFCEKFSWKK